MVEAEVEAARIKSGMLDPRDAEATEQGRRTLADHLDDYRSFLLEKGGTEEHVDLTIDRARRIIGLARGESLARIEASRKAAKAERARVTAELAGLVSGGRLADLTPASVQSAQFALKMAGPSLATCNHHRAAIRGFSLCVWNDGRARQDSLAAVAGYNANQDRRHDRRTLWLDESTPPD